MNIGVFAPGCKSEPIPFPPRPKPPGLLRRRIGCFGGLTEFCNEGAAVILRDEPPTELISLANEISRGTAPLADGTWVLIAPYGDVPNVTAGRRVIQRFDRTAAREMVNNFKSAIGKVSNLLRGAPLLIGHPDATDPEMQRKYTDHRAYGRFKEIDDRADGLWGKLFAGTTGKELINEEGFIYLSPRWYAAKQPIAVEGGVEIYRPIWLASVGLTDNPNITTAAPLPFINERKTQPTGATMKPRELVIFLAGLLALENEARNQPEEIPAEFTDKVKAGFQTIKEKAAKADTLTVELQNERTAHGQVKDKLTKAETEFANERKARVTDALADAITLGRIKEADKADWERRLGLDFVNEHAAIRKLPAAVKTTATTKGRTRGAGADATTTLARCTEFINEAYNKLPDTMKHSERWLQASKDAAKAHPEFFNQKQSEE